MCIRDRACAVKAMRSARGKYVYGRQTKEQYVIQHVAKAKHLRPPLTEGELIHKLAYHFEQNVYILSRDDKRNKTARKSTSAIVSMGRFNQ